MFRKIIKGFKTPLKNKNSPRNVILHGHIFKNAGSTFDWCLNRNFGARFCDHREDVIMRSGGAKYLEEYLISHPELNSLSSHHLCTPLPRNNGLNIFPVFFFRHPIDRIQSVYSFERKQPERTPGSIHAKKLNFYEYVNWRMREDVNPTIRDYQVKYCLPKQCMAKNLNGILYQQAIDYIVGLNSLVGVVDRYDESMVVFENELREVFPDIDLAYVAQNVGVGLDRMYLFYDAQYVK